ncbi:MAG: PAS domain-containing protein [Rhizomicrobium sp.]|nr:PAS domain-containing protein [Rhizomicrobium sp.]
MSFYAFEETITSPELREVARHWNNVRGSRAMPGWSDIRPAQITAQLPIVWSYKYDRAADAFTGRLAGDQIEQIFGRNFRGSPMTEIYPKGEFPKMFAQCRRVAYQPALYKCEGMVFCHLNRYGQGERIILPLADDGILGDGILGATKYQSLGSTRTADPPYTESWFPL